MTAKSCAACPAQRVCLSGTDCQSRVCALGICAAPTCIDGVQNGTESDIDCGGGVCAGCGNGKKCNLGTDCQSGVCTAGTCSPAAPTCSDGMKNGSETDVDC